MKQYLELVADVLDNGTRHENRTGVPTTRVFGRQFRHSLFNGFPLLTTKHMVFRLIVEELLWMLRGDTNIATLQDVNVHIWDEWADANGNLGRVYGAQWRDWGRSGMDQIDALVRSIRSNPESRRHIVTAWNPEEIEDAKLPPCHCFFQVNVDNSFMDLHMYQRSADIFLGVPFNIASYALLLCILAQTTGKEPRDLIISYGDLHAYENHIEQLYQQTARNPYRLPKLQLNPPFAGAMPWDYREHNIGVYEYNHHPKLAGEVAV